MNFAQSATTRGLHMSKQNTNLVDKLKTALQRLLKWTEAHTGIYSIRVCPKKDDPDKVAKEKVRAIALAHNVLSLQRRNCDVGTVEEQVGKFRLFCESHKPAEPEFTETGELLCPVSGCELGVCNYGQCALKWAQLPYEESDGVSK